MHSLMIGAAVVLMAVWLFFLPLRLAIELLRASDEQVRPLSPERACGAAETSTDDME
jgi:hypothetical protein